MFDEFSFKSFYNIRKTILVELAKRVVSQGHANLVWNEYISVFTLKDIVQFNVIKIAQ